MNDPFKSASRGSEQASLDGNGFETSQISGIPACSICGRQDETLRLVIYPYVISLIVVTFRRAFTGLWCRKHRIQRLGLAGLITSTIGWLGIPFGFLFTPLALYKLAKGGEQPADVNLGILRRLADHKQKGGDFQGARRCLEEALKFKEEGELREGLIRLYRSYPSTIRGSGLATFIPFLSVMFGASLIGVMIGGIDYGFTRVLFQFLGEEVPIYVAIMTWVPLVAMLFLGGLILFHLVRWGLESSKTHQPLLAAALAFISSALALYGVMEGRVIGEYIEQLAMDFPFESIVDFINTTGMVLTQGGTWIIEDALVTGEMTSIIYLLVIVVAGIFYFAVSINEASRTARWEQGIRNLLEGVSAPRITTSVSGWLAIAAVVLGLVLLTSVFLFQGIPSPTAEVYEHLERAEELWMVNDLDGAILELKEAISLDPDSIPARLMLGWSYYYRGDIEEALPEFQRIVQLDSAAAEAYLGIGFVHLALEEWVAAVEEFERVLTLAADDMISAQAYYGLGTVYYQQRHLDDAVSNLEQAIILDPEIVLAQIQLSIALIERAEFDKAAERCQVLISMDPNWAAPYALLSSVYYMMDQPESSEVELAKALALEPEDTYSLYLLGGAYWRKHEFSKVEPYLMMLLEFSPDSEDVLITLARLYSVQQAFELALEKVNEALALKGDYAEGYLTRGYIYADRKDLDAALTELLWAVELEPQNSEVHSFLSFVYFHRGQNEEALMSAQTAITLNPYNSNGYRNMAFSYHEQGDLDRALQAALEAVRLYPKDDAAHYILGLIYADKGEEQKAISEYQSFLELFWDRAYIRDYKEQAEAYLQERSSP